MHYSVTVDVTPLSETSFMNTKFLHFLLRGAYGAKVGCARSYTKSVNFVFGN